MSSIRCRVSGCDLDPCGVCRRCGDESRARHSWTEAERKEACYRRRVCERCEVERLTPDHDWDSTPSVGADETNLECRRCGLRI